MKLHFRLSARQNLHHWIIAGLILWHHKHNVNFGEFWLPGSEVVKLFSCSTQLSIKFIKVLINTEIIKIN